MIDLNNLMLLTENYIRENASLPDVKLKTCTSMGNALDVLTTQPFRYDPTLSAKAQLVKFMEALNIAQQDEFFYKHAFEILDEIANNIGNKLKNTKSILDEVANTVNDLAKQIEEEKTKQLAKDATIAKYKQLNIDDINDIDEFNSLDWDKLTASMGARMLIEYFIEKTGIQESSFNLQTLGKARGRLPFVTGDNGMFNNILLTQEQSNDFISAIQDKTKDLDISQIKFVIKILTDKKSTLSYCKRIVEKTINLKDPSDLVMDFLNDVFVLSKGISVISSIIDELFGNDTILKLQTNIKNIKEYVYFMSYVCFFYRKVIFNNSVILSNKMLNPDVFVTFQKDGGSQLMIAQYLNYMYPEKAKLPDRGISGTSILDMSKTIKEKLDSNLKELNLKVKLKTNFAIQEAIKKVLTKYIQDVKDNDTEKEVPANIDELIKHKAEISASSDVSIEDVLYIFVLKLFYSNTFVYTLYKNLGAKYLSKISTTEELNNEDLDIIESEVYANLITKFVLDNFCE